MSWVEVVALLLAPTAAFWTAERALRALSRVDPWPWQRRRTVRPLGPTLEQIGADLHRLSGEIARIERTNPPAKAARIRAAALAYDDVLMLACRTLEVDAPARPPLAPLQRLETEAALARQGLDW